MFRSGLLLYLVLTSAVGPWCCPFATQLIQAATPSFHHGEEKTANNCCQGKDSPTSNHSSDVPGKTLCKCNESRMGPTTTRSCGLDVFSREYKSSVEIGIVISAFEMSRIGLVLFAECENPRNTIFSFMEGQDILRASQILLC